MLIFRWILYFSLLFSPVGYAMQAAVTQPIPINEISGYEEFPPAVKELVTQAFALTQKNLTYLYGSANPDRGGMDCSGTIFYLLKLSKLVDVPRSSDQIYQWAVDKGKFYYVTSHDFSSPDFNHLKPGDLLFWEGTYKTNRQSPISHVMLYLGANKQNQPLMFGASDGRSYQGKSMWGVSVFDFKLPAVNAKARFVGYSCIPHLTCAVMNDSGEKLE